MENFNIPQPINTIFDEEYASHLHIGKMYLANFKKLFQLFTIEMNVRPKYILTELAEFFGAENYSLVHKRETFSRKKKSGELKLNRFSYIAQVSDEVWVEVERYGLSFLFSDVKKIPEFENFSKIVQAKSKNKTKKNNFYMLVKSAYGPGFELQEFPVRKMDIDIALNYNDDFVEVDKAIQHFLTDDKSNGITMLHGKFGTGKSSYIRYLIKTIQKRFIYLPLNMMYDLSSPDILNFMTEYRDSILILEDCEELIKPRNSNGSNLAIVNLLNIGDGLLSDALAFKLICTFNADLKQIDPAIMRKGRLSVRYEFKPLTVEKAQALAEKQNIDIKIDKPMTIADIYNREQLNGDKTDDLKVGF